VLAKSEPKWRRRKDARPAEIIAAAFAVFAEKGFSAARLDEIAGRAGLSKGALYLYFETKEDLFHAVVREAVSPKIAKVITFAEGFEGPFAELVRALLPLAGSTIGSSGLGQVIKMVVGESRNFPELARFWHDEVAAPAIGAMSRLIERAQARGEIRPGPARFHAMSLMGPLLMGVLWRETFGPIGAEPIDLEAMARQHVESVLTGLLVPRERLPG
jgi:AcrR family transcriptional regulator